MDNDTNSTDEKVKEWSEMSGIEMKAITLSIAQGYRDGGVEVTDGRIFRILCLGKPKCVLGYRGGKLTNFRVHNDSVDLMRLIADSYVQRSLIEEIEEEFPDMLDPMGEEE